MRLLLVPGWIWSQHPRPHKGFPRGSAGKESARNARDLGSIPGLGRSPGEGKDSPLQYSGLENSTDCIVHGVAKSRTRVSAFHLHFHPRSQNLFKCPSNSPATEPTMWWTVTPLCRINGKRAACESLSCGPESAGSSPCHWPAIRRLENPTDRGAWRATVHGVPKSWTQLSG